MRITISFLAVTTAGAIGGAL
ncbi:unnamed protein product, partial [Rotaria socialis]